MSLTDCSAITEMKHTLCRGKQVHPTINTYDLTKQRNLRILFDNLDMQTFKETNRN